MLNRSASLAMSTSILNALPGKLDIIDIYRVFSISRQSKEEGKDQKSINQAPHLTKEAYGKVTTSQLDITTESVR